jgi:hypothetical protein
MSAVGLVQCRIGLSWQPETVRWHCPRGIVLLPVVDMDVRLPFSLIWKKDNSSRLLQRFVAQVGALGRKTSMRADGIKETGKHSGNPQSPRSEARSTG